VNRPGRRNVYCIFLTAFHRKGRISNSTSNVLRFVQLIIFRKVLSKDNRIAMIGVFVTLPPKLPLIRAVVNGEVAHFNTLSVSNNVMTHVLRKASFR